MFAVLAMLGGTAAADGALVGEPQLGPRLSLSQQMLDKVNLWSMELGTHLNRLSLETIAWEFDVRKRRARLGFDSGESDKLSLKLDSNIVFKRGYARVKARINLGIAGEKLHIELPEVDVVPRSYDGQRYVEIRLPLLRGSF
jgi:hypothetical protein